MKKILFSLGFLSVFTLLLSCSKESAEQLKSISVVKSKQSGVKINYFDTPIAHVTTNTVEILNRESIVKHLEPRLSTNPFKKEILHDLEIVKEGNAYIMLVSSGLGYTRIPLTQIGEYLFEVSYMESGVSQFTFCKDCEEMDCLKDTCVKTILTIEGAGLSGSTYAFMIYGQ